MLSCCLRRTGSLWRSLLLDPEDSDRLLEGLSGGGIGNPDFESGGSHPNFSRRMEIGANLRDRLAQLCIVVEIEHGKGNQLEIAQLPYPVRVGLLDGIIGRLKIVIQSEGGTYVGDERGSSRDASTEKLHCLTHLRQLVTRTG